jgi:4-hydroxy-2-oxoheptanedioate aldolase
MIAAVEGVDVLLVGAGDLTAEMGIPGDFAHPDVEAAFTKVINACARYNKTAGMGGIYDHAMMEKYIKLGSRFILSGSDLSFLMMGAKARSSFLREAGKNRPKA